MPFSECPACETEVSPSALTCPHCGDPLWAKEFLNLRHPLSLLKATKSVSVFCIVALFLSVCASFAPSLLRAFTLAPLGSDSQGLLPINVVTHAFVHPSLIFLLLSIFPLVICGSILEPRLGSRTMLFIILGGILAPGLLCIAFGDTSMLGSSGVFYAMVGGILALLYRYWAKIPLVQRILAGLILAWIFLNIISVFAMQGVAWTTPTAIPVGYVIALKFTPFSDGDEPPASEEATR